MLALILLVAGAASLSAALMAVVLRPWQPTVTVTLTEPAGRGEILTVGQGRSSREYIVRAVLEDLTLQHVVAVARIRRWHKWAWTRRYL